MPNQAPPALPSYDEAYNLILQDVWGSQFATKLASYGCGPATPEEFQEAVLLARRLKAAEEQQQQKEAASGQGLFRQANQALDGVYRDYGVVETSAIKEAGWELARTRPDLYNAVIAVRQAQYAASQQA
jgi:hypothetical protein